MKEREIRKNYVESSMKGGVASVWHHHIRCVDDGKIENEKENTHEKGMDKVEVYETKRF